MKPRLTFEQHQELGTELKAMRERLVKMVVLLESAYPHRAMKRRPGKALQAVDDLRCLLDSCVFAENPDLDTQTLVRVYYPDTGAEVETLDGVVVGGYSPTPF